MRMAWTLGFLLIACSDKTTSGDSTNPIDDSSVDTDSVDTSGGGDTGTGACDDGPGVIEGILLGSDNLPLNTGKVRLYDKTGSDEKVADNVDTDGAYHLVFGKGSYVVRGEYSTCVGEDIPVYICGEQTVYLNITLDCAP